MNNNVDLDGNIVEETQWNNLKNDRQFKAEMQQLVLILKLIKYQIKLNTIML